MENVDKTINDMCNWIQKELEKSGQDFCERKDIAEMAKALAVLILSRNFINKN